MELAEKVLKLQAIYAGALADNLQRLGNEGILEKVTQQKKGEQLAGGKTKASQMGIEKEEDVFLKLAELMGCADWKIEECQDGNGFTATATRCMLCAFAKRMGTQSPCNLYCLDPMEGMVKGINENASFTAESTLFSETQCRVVVSSK